MAPVNTLVHDALALATRHVAAGEPDQALRNYRLAAEQGDPIGCFESARLLLFGLTATADPTAAIAYLERAEKAGFAAASELLLQLALGAVAYPRDQRINARLLRGVERGFPASLLTAALHLSHNRDPRDQALCTQLLTRAAEQGNAIGAALLAERLGFGEDGNANPAAADDIRAQLANAGFNRLPRVQIDHAPSRVAPPAQIALESVLQPPTARVLSTLPPVAMIDGLLTAAECRLLIASARPHLDDSRVTDPLTGIASAHPIRTSRHTSFDPLLETSASALIQLRLAAAAGVTLAQCEHLAVLHYLPGQEYRPHRDYLPPGALAINRPQAGNRMRTLCVYLNNVEAGGETEFPAAKLTIQPQPGRAIVFDNLDASGRPIAESIHAGLPVRSGEKWLATLWIRERQYRAL